MLKKTAQSRLRDLSRDAGRVAHWLLNDRGFTRAVAARHLSQIARRAWPVEKMILGDAAKFVPDLPDPAIVARVKHALKFADEKRFIAVALDIDDVRALLTFIEPEAPSNG